MNSSTGNQVPRGNDSSVDEAITAVSGEWEFNEEVANSFDSHVRRSVPFYEEMQRMTAELSEYFVRNESVIYDLGCSTGETLSNLHETHRSKENLQLFGVDRNEQMIAQARSQFECEEVHFRVQDVRDLSFSPRPDLVTALLTFQFLNLEDREKLLQQVYDRLRSGGALILFEKVHAPESEFEDIWLELYWDFKRRQGLDPGQILSKAGSIRGVLKPLTVEENQRLLRDTGFDRVAPFFQWYNWVGFLATCEPHSRNRMNIARGRQQSGQPTSVSDSLSLDSSAWNPSNGSGTNQHDQ